MPFTVKKLKGIDTSSLQKLGDSVVDFAKFVEDEFAQLATALQSTEASQIWNTPPPRPRKGTMAYADGTHWNPGSGEGFYEYTSAGVWVPMFTVAGPATVTSIAGNTGAFTLNSTSGITNLVNDIRLSQASASQFGAVKVDNTTIVAAGGVLSTGVPALSRITGSLGADVALNNTANYFVGPSVAQGTSGVWFASGGVSILTGAGVDTAIHARLWDGTTVVASIVTVAKQSQGMSISLSGFFVSPTGNIRIECKATGNTTAVMSFNTSGNAKDCTITAIRIG